ncbi:hypothetical protein [Bacillus sp. ISL-45]|uniref:hypothetical protein n=1 Tax=Bacillus sp. ISL-45 TaxID=2819128 RepID=UPI001BE5E951|nr:hypothetical protein [Bacillus sp. ISL-45]MBT2663858.1 hypothetical protein [Bacillus sp. ISL-45]
MRSLNTVNVDFGFVGLGLAGGNVAGACVSKHSSYGALFINTNSMDQKSLAKTYPSYGHFLIGGGLGTGRNIKTAEELYKENVDEIKDALGLFARTEFIWVCASLGGATGTGFLPGVINILTEQGFAGHIGLILIIPHKNEEWNLAGHAVPIFGSDNQLIKQLPIILIDNTKQENDISAEYRSIGYRDYLNKSNEMVASVIHNNNLLSSSIPYYGGSNFDSLNYLEFIKTPGILAFSSFKIDLNMDSEHSEIKRLSHKIEKNIILSDGYELNDANMIQISFLTGDSNATHVFTVDFKNIVFKEMESILFPKKSISYLTTETAMSEVQISIMCAGIPVERNELVKELIKRAKQEELMMMLEDLEI